MQCIVFLLIAIAVGAEILGENKLFKITNSPDYSTSIRSIVFHLTTTKIGITIFRVFELNISNFDNIYLR